MNPTALALGVLLAATPANKFIYLTATTDANLSATIEIAGKQMKVELCCPATRQYSIVIGSGTCAKPGISAGAVVIAHNDWNPVGGRMVANVPTIFPLRAPGLFHLIVADMAAAWPNTVACGDVPRDLVTR